MQLATPDSSPTGKLFYPLCNSHKCRNQAYPSLKIGEKNVPREFFASANTEHVSGDKLTQNYSRFGTDYRENVSSAVKPTDYTVPCKDANQMSKHPISITLSVHYDLSHQPNLFGYTKRAHYEQVTGKQSGSGFSKVGEQAMGGSVSHWTTTYRAEVESNLQKEPIRSRPPMWSLPREAYSSQRGFWKTEFNMSYGANGDNPRDKLPHDATKQTH